MPPAGLEAGEQARPPLLVERQELLGEDKLVPGVDRGALASTGLNYIQVGRLGGLMVAEVLNGKKPGDIDAVIAYQKLPNFDVVVNKKSAASMSVTLPQAVLARAARVVE